MNTLHSKKYTNIYGKEITKFSSSYLCGGGGGERMGQGGLDNVSTMLYL